MHEFDLEQIHPLIEAVFHSITYKLIHYVALHFQQIANNKMFKFGNGFIIIR